MFEVNCSLYSLNFLHGWDHCHDITITLHGLILVSVCCDLVILLVFTSCSNWFANFLTPLNYFSSFLKWFIFLTDLLCVRFHPFSAHLSWQQILCTVCLVISISNWNRLRVLVKYVTAGNCKRQLYSFLLLLYTVIWPWSTIIPMCLCNIHQYFKTATYVLYLPKVMWSKSQSLPL